MFSTGVNLGEKVSPLNLKLCWVIKLVFVFWALQMEPEDRLHVASVIVDAVFHGFLEHTVHIVTLKNLTLVRSLDRWLVEKIH